MTVYILRYSSDYHNESHVREPFTSYAAAVKRFNYCKRFAIKENENADYIDGAARTYHIEPNDKPETFIKKWTVKTTADLITLIKKI